MRIPTEGEHLVSASGKTWLVEAVTTDIDPDDTAAFVVEIVLMDDADDMDAVGEELTNGEFQEFCQREGVVLR